MAWEKRGSRSYYYRKRREGRRVVSEYMPGELGSLAATLHEKRQAESEQQRQAERIEREKIRAADTATNQVGDLVSAIVDTALIAEGYHRHKGQWRKKRHGRQSNDW